MLQKDPPKRESYFYNATVKQPTAIPNCFTCHFTQSESGAPETNLVTVCSNTLSVFTLEEHEIKFRTNSQFNDKIVECIPVPVPKQVSRLVKNRDAATTQIEATQMTNTDYLFVLTKNFNCALLYYSQAKNSVEVISRGNLEEKGTGEKRERPYPIFVGSESKFIALMLYENVIKIIPLVRKTDS